MKNTGSHTIQKRLQAIHHDKKTLKIPIATERSRNVRDYMIDDDVHEEGYEDCQFQTWGYFIRLETLD